MPIRRGEFPPIHTKISYFQPLAVFSILILIN